MNNIEIEGLTVHQVTLLDEMWKCDTPDEYYQFRATLTENERKQCDVLQILVIFAELDHIYETEVGDAIEVITSIMVRSRRS